MIGYWCHIDPILRLDPNQMPCLRIRLGKASAGSMVVLGVLLGILVSPWFVALSGFVGAGLMFAGISGTCALAGLLSLMPWNRLQGPSTADASVQALNA